MSHSRNGQRQGFQNVLKSRVLEPLISRHSRMAKKCDFQNVFRSEIPFFLPFRNGQLAKVPEHLNNDTSGTNGVL